MQKHFLTSVNSLQTEAQPMNCSISQNNVAQINGFTANPSVQPSTQPTQQLTVAACQPNQQTANAAPVTTSSMASNSVSQNVAFAASAGHQTSPKASEQEMVIPSLLTSNGSLDWDAVEHWGIYKYHLDPVDRTRIKRPVIPLVGQAQKHLLPSKLSIELHKLVKQVYTITNRSKQNTAHKVCVDTILRHTLAMIDLAVVVEKRHGNTQPLYALDEVHEMTRRMWFTLYEMGFFGDSKGGRKYSAYLGIQDFARINKIMDTIGRIIGSFKKNYAASVDNHNKNVVNSKRFCR